MKPRKLFIHSCLLSLLLAATGAVGFVDPLDAPAQMSAMAGTSKLLAITAASA